MTSSDEVKRSLSVARPAGNLRTQVVEKLRQAIVDGHFAPGARLIERDLCDLLGVSRTLVREALRQLEAEGHVENVLYRGPIVAATSADEARQLYEIRAVLEGWAAKQCAEHASDEDLNELFRLVEELAAAEQRGDLKQMLDVLDTFHEKLLQACGQPDAGRLSPVAEKPFASIERHFAKAAGTTTANNRRKAHLVRRSEATRW